MDIKQSIAYLLHKEQLFFPVLQDLSNQIVEGAKLLTDMISEEDEHRLQEDTYDRIKEIETRCDQLADTLVARLSKTTFTPYPKNALHELADTLDNVMDYINAAAKRMMLYQPESLESEMMHMAEIVIECAKALRTAFAALPELRSNPKPVLEQCQRLHMLEHEGDDVYGEFVHDLFEGETDAKELIKVKEIMGQLEKATDFANKVGKQLRALVVVS